MPQSVLLSQGPAISATLLQIFQEQKDAECVDVLRAGTPAIEFLRWDGWNDEVAVFGLQLSIPPILFARMERTLRKIEERIESKLGKLRVGENEQLSSCSINPQVLAGPGAGGSQSPSSVDVARIWGSGLLRMFISHVSKHKAAAAAVKMALGQLGIAGFVAHEDIEPSLEWRKEIETALQSMNVLCAILTPEFRESQWTDQEVGFALGRNVPIVPVRLGLDPYGFMGHVQGVPGLNKPEALASAIFDATMRYTALRGSAMDALIGAVAEAQSFASAKAAMNKVVAQKSLLAPSQVERLLRAARDNSQVNGAFGVPEQIRAIAKAAGVQLPAEKPKAASDEDDIPF